MAIRPFLPAHLEVYQILAELAREASTYLGIGVQEGECVRHVVQANPKIDLTLCDPWGSTHGGTGRGSPEHIHVLLTEEQHRGGVKILTGLSQELVPRLDFNVSFDLIYIDGDHSELAALDDLRNCWWRCRWAMVVHDVHMPPVWSALTKFLAEGINASEAQVVYCNGGTGTAVVYRRA